MTRDFIKRSCKAGIYRVLYFIIWRVFYISPYPICSMYIQIPFTPADLIGFQNDEKNNNY